MVSSSPQTYTISDFVEWSEKKQLILAPEFQRGAVWTPAAKTFLIDTILKGLPIPQIYVRTRINTSTKTTIRELVDGQQRMRAILEFASGSLRLSSKSNDYTGKRYNHLTAEEQESFLSYTIPTVQLINAGDEDVLEVFARLNSYSVKVTPPEMRHAKYSEPVKWAIWNTARTWRHLLAEKRVVSVRDAVRMKDQTLVAELYRIIDSGLQDGGEQKIDAYYRLRKKQDEDFFLDLDLKVDEILDEISDRYADALDGTTFFNAPNFIILFSVIAAQKNYLPNIERFDAEEFLAADTQQILELLVEVAAAVENQEVDGPHGNFVRHSKSSTQRIASREARLKHLAKKIG